MLCFEKMAFIKIKI